MSPSYVATLHIIVAIAVVIISAVLVYQFYRLRSGILPSYWTATLMMWLGVIGVLVGFLLIAWFGWKAMQSTPYQQNVPMMQPNYPAVPSGGPQFAQSSFAVNSI